MKDKFHKKKQNDNNEVDNVRVKIKSGDSSNLKDEKKRPPKKRKYESSSTSSSSTSTSSSSTSSSSSSDTTSEDENISKKGRSKLKIKGDGKRDSSSSSSYSSDSSSRGKKKKIIKRKKVVIKKGKKRKSSSSSSTSSTSSSSDEISTKKSKKCEKENLGESMDIPMSLMEKNKLMAPMTKEEWEKKQSVVKRVYDESTGRHRLIKGDGEILEEIVSKERHKAINQKATKGDGDYFQNKLMDKIKK